MPASHLVPYTRLLLNAAPNRGYSYRRAEELGCGFERAIAHLFCSLTAHFTDEVYNECSFSEPIGAAWYMLGANF